MKNYPDNVHFVQVAFTWSTPLMSGKTIQRQVRLEKEGDVHANFCTYEYEWYELIRSIKWERPKQFGNRWDLEIHLIGLVSCALANPAHHGQWFEFIEALIVCPSCNFWVLLCRAARETQASWRDASCFTGASLDQTKPWGDITTYIYILEYHYHGPFKNIQCIVTSLTDLNTISLGISISVPFGVRVLTSSGCERIPIFREILSPSWCLHPSWLAAKLCRWEKRWRNGCVHSSNGSGDHYIKRLRSAWDIRGILKELYIYIYVYIIYIDLKTVLAKESCSWKGFTTIL